MNKPKYATEFFYKKRNILRFNLVLGILWILVSMGELALAFTNAWHHRLVNLLVALLISFMWGFFGTIHIRNYLRGRS